MRPRSIEECEMADFFTSGSRNAMGESPEERQKRRSLRKAQRVLRSSREPMIPFFCKIFFFAMIAMPILDLVMEIGLQIQAEKKLPVGAFLLRLSWSAFVIWGFFAMFLVLLSAIQLVRNAKYGYEERVYRFKDEMGEGEHPEDFDQVEYPTSEKDREAMTLYSKVIPGGTKARYLRYVLIAGIGTGVLGLFYLICRIAVRSGA